MYKSGAVRYVEMGGKLTPKALLTLYREKARLGLDDKWLEIYAQAEIPKFVNLMSRA